MPDATSTSQPAILRRDDLLVFITALLARLLCYWQLADSPLIELLMGDGYTYDKWAQTIAAGDWVGSTTFYQAPLYPYFMGLVYALFGHSLTALRLVQLTLGSIACVFLLFATARWFGRRVGIAAGIMLALYPPAIYFDLIIQKSVLDGILLTALMWWFAVSGQNARLRQMCIGGLLLGLLTLSRENALILLPAVIGWAVYVGKSVAPDDSKRDAKKHTFLAPLLVIVGMSLVLLPVCIRNYAVGGTFHLTTSQFGPNFFIGNNADADGHYMELAYGRGDARYERIDAKRLAEQATGRELSADEVSAYWADAAFTWIKQNPGDWLALLGRKTLLTFNRIEISDVDDIYVATDDSVLLRAMLWVWHLGLLIPLAIVGFAGLSCSDMKRLWPIVACALLYAFGVVLFFVFARYRYPIAVLLLPFAANGLFNLFYAVKRKHCKPLLYAMPAAVVVAVIVNFPIESISRMKAGTYHNIGHTYWQEQEAAEPAIGALSRALMLAPDRRSSHELLGTLYMKQGQWAQAEAHLRGSLDNFTVENAAVQINLAIAIAQQGRHAEAIDILKALASGLPNDPTVQLNLAIALANSGSVNQAIEQLSAFCDTPHALQAHFRLLVKMLRDEKRTDDAIAAEQKMKSRFSTGDAVH